MQLLRQAFRASSLVVSVMGAHAGEQSDVIFGRKMTDCEATGSTFWVAKSRKSRPEQIQSLCSAGPGYVVFIAPATAGGARPTVASQRAVEYSADRVHWCALPEGIGPVTGRMDRAAAALVLDRLTTDVDGELDLWHYSDADAPNMPVRLGLGTSTARVVRRDSSLHPRRMNSRHRPVIAVGRLRSPYCVWLR